MKVISKFLTVAVLLAIMVLVTVDLHTMASPAEESASATVPTQSNADIQVDPVLLSQFNDKQEAGYLIYFKEKADLSAAFEMDWEARGWYVVKTLQAVSDESQSDVQNYLKSENIKYQSFWIDNVIVVENSSLQSFNGLMSFNEIEALVARQTMQVIEPIREDDKGLNAITAVEPNITHVLAPDVWASGIRGEGMVVANIDTGVRSTHEALVRQYRGTTTGSDDYNWLGETDGSATPDDDHGHGTHTMGTTVGEDASLTNQIGIAPGAQWIACDGCSSTLGCPDTALLTCAQWVAAPYPIGDPGSPDPNMRPHVVNNSWGDCGQSYDTWYEGSITAWHAAGVYPVFSNGNASNCGYSSPPGLNTVGNPARSGNVTGVGSSGESNGQYATHSNWGPTDNPDTVNPVTGWEDLKPQVLAPGVSIRSSVPTSDTSYEDGWSGTSMSAPHVTGLVALMWQAGSCLIGDYAQTETIIEETATPIYYDDGSGARWPNYATGWGEINVQAAVEQAQAMCGPTGTIIGNVTDDNTSAPLEGVNIVATQSMTIVKTTSTDSNGDYTIGYAAEGTYTVTASIFGYLPAEIDGVSVTADTTETVDIELTMAPSSIITGYVTDINTGWPLYASIDIDGAPIDAIWTNPETGYYSVVLPQGTVYSFTVEAFVDGYLVKSESVDPASGDIQKDFALDVNTSTCAAPGYEPNFTTYFTESFDSIPAFPYGGWDVIAVTNTAGKWITSTNTVHPSGNPPHSGEQLVYFNSYSASSGSSSRLFRTVDLDLAIASEPALSIWLYHDAGYTSSSDRVQVQISTDDGASWTDIGDAIPRYNGTTGWANHVVDISTYGGDSNVRLGFLGISGYGNDVHMDDISIIEPGCATPSGGLVLGNVYENNDLTTLVGAVVTNETGETTNTVAMPDDDNVDDGFYVLYADAAPTVFTATLSPYSSDVETVAVMAGDAVSQDFYLDAGQLAIAPAGLDVSLEMGLTTTLPITLSNLGGASVNWEIIENDLLVVRHDADAANAMETALNTLGYTYVSVTSAEFSAMTVDELLSYGAILYAGISSSTNEPLLISFLDAGGSLYISDNDLGYFRNGTDFYDNYLQSTYGVDNAGDNLLGEDIMTGLDLDVSDDPFPDGFTVGAEGTRIFTYTAAAYAGGVAVDRNGYRAIYTAFDYDELLEADYAPLMTRVLAFIGAGDLGWLAEDPNMGTLAAVSEQSIDVIFDAGAAEIIEPGVYQAMLKFAGNTPYDTPTLPVTMTVTPNATVGLLEGVVQGLGHCDVTPMPIANAAVTITNGSETWNRVTDSNGQYGLYLDESYSPVTVTVSAVNHLGDFAANVVITGQTTTTQDFGLRETIPCIAIEPAMFDVALNLNDMMTLPLTITNTGAGSSAWHVGEAPVAATMVEGTAVVRTVSANTTGKQLINEGSFVAYQTPENNIQSPLGLINDGSFEADPASGPWTEVDSTNCAPWIGDWESIVGVVAYEGSQYYWAGGGCNSTANNNSAEQSITIPAGHGEITFWYQANRTDADDPTNNGQAYVKINGIPVWTLETSQANNTTGWVQATVDVGAYTGQTVALTFGLDQGNSGYANVFFDYIETNLTVDILWLGQDPATGTVVADSTSVAGVVFDASQVTGAGVYQAQLTVASGDAMYPSITIPVTMTVISEAKIFLPIILGN